MPQTAATKKRKSESEMKMFLDSNTSLSHEKKKQAQISRSVKTATLGKKVVSAKRGNFRNKTRKALEKMNSIDDQQQQETEMSEMQF
jgi:hypothetical protein